MYINCVLGEMLIWLNCSYKSTKIEEHRKEDELRNAQLIVNGGIAKHHLHQFHQYVPHG